MSAVKLFPFLLIVFGATFSSCQDQHEKLELDFKNIIISNADSIRISLRYTPHRRIPFISQSFSILGFWYDKIKYRKPQLKSIGNNKFQIDVKPQLKGMGNYTLESISIQYSDKGNGKAFFCVSQVTHTKAENTTLAVLEDNSMNDNELPRRIIAARMLHSSVQLFDHSKDELYQYFEKDRNGSLLLNKDNRPLLTDVGYSKYMQQLKEQLLK